nr:hypothetical protein [Verrucomicrobiota bacterium]
MNARVLFFLLPGGFAAGLAASLVDAAVKSFVLLLLATGAVVALRKSAAATRHVIWAAALVCALVMPLLSVCLPQWRVLPPWLRLKPGPGATSSLTILQRPPSAQTDMQQASVEPETPIDRLPRASDPESPATA